MGARSKWPSSSSNQARVIKKSICIEPRALIAAETAAEERWCGCDSGPRGDDALSGAHWAGRMAQQAALETSRHLFAAAASPPGARQEVRASSDTTIMMGHYSSAPRANAKNGSGATNRSLGRRRRLPCPPPPPAACVAQWHPISAPYHVTYAPPSCPLAHHGTPIYSL